MGWQLRGHTADVILALDAPDEVALASAAVDGVRAVLVGESPVAADAWRDVPAAVDLAAGEAFFRFVRELFYLADVEGFLPAEVESTAAGWRVFGERFDAARHVPHYQVKAVTRHGWRYDRHPEGLRVEMVLDL
jgi:SHS2 domain-containing protein